MKYLAVLLFMTISCVMDKPHIYKGENQLINIIQNPLPDFVWVDVRRGGLDSLFTVYLAPESSMSFKGGLPYKVDDWSVDPNATAAKLWMEKKKAEKARKDRLVQEFIDETMNLP